MIGLLKKAFIKVNGYSSDKEKIKLKDGILLQKLLFMNWSGLINISNVPNFFIKNNFLFIEKVYPNNNHVNIEGYINYLLDLLKI